MDELTVVQTAQVVVGIDVVKPTFQKYRIIGVEIYNALIVVYSFQG